jgi:hypothetical protein
MRVCPEQDKDKTLFPEEPEDRKDNLFKETYRGRGEDQLFKRTAHPLQPALKGVACHHLLVILGVVAGLEGGRPRNVGEFEGPGVPACGALQQGGT